MKKLNCLLLILVFVFSFTFTSFAETYTINNGTVIDLDDYENGDTINVSGRVEIINSGYNVEDVAIVCAEGTILILNKVDIRSDRCPITFTGSGNALSLKGDNGLMAEHYSEPAIKCLDDCELAIGGSGELVINNEYNHNRGITSDGNGNVDLDILGGSLYIYSDLAGIFVDRGTIDIQGENCRLNIYTGEHEESCIDGNDFNLNIFEEARVELESGSFAGCIGRTPNGTGTVNISDYCNVNCIASEGFGIGSKEGNTCVNISGGTVNIDSKIGIGIDSLHGMGCTEINITGGAIDIEARVTAIGSPNDIGYLEINISGGTVNAKSNHPYYPTIGFGAWGNDRVNIIGDSIVYVNNLAGGPDLSGLVNVYDNSSLFLKNDNYIEDYHMFNVDKHSQEEPVENQIFDDYEFPYEFNYWASLGFVPRGNVLYLGNGNDSGTPPLDEIQYSVGEEVLVKGNTNLAKTGYDELVSWRYDRDIYYENHSLPMDIYSITLKARWVGSLNSYKVEHYKFNREIDDYELWETEIINRDTGDYASSEYKDYEGYERNYDYIFIKEYGEVAADGSTVLKLYYDIITYDAGFNKNTDTSDVSGMPDDQTIDYENKVTEPDNDPIRAGYTLDGWYKEAACDNEWDFDADTVTSDVTLYAKWTADSDTAYKVKHHKENDTLDGYDLADTENLTGTTDTDATAVDKEYAGYTLKEAVNGNIAGDGTLVLDMYYDRNEYEVTYNKNTEDSVSDMASSESVHYELKAVEPLDPTRTGYTFSGWYKEAACDNEWDFDRDTVTDDVTMYAKWTANTDTAYTVNHYKEKSDSVGYELADTQELKGTTSTEVTGVDKKYSGYTLKESVSGTVLADGTLVLDMYYDEDEVIIPVVKEKEDTFELTYSGNLSEEHEAGDVITLSEGKSFTKEGYVLEGWSDVDKEYLLGGLYVMPERDVNFNEIWLKDSDNDGISDDDEEKAGSDPLDEDDKPLVGNIVIKVVDSNGNPINGMKLILNSSPITSISNSNGVVSFNDVTVSHHTLTLIEDEEVLAKYDFDLSKGETSMTEVLADEYKLIAKVDTDNIVLNVTITENENGTFLIADADVEEETLANETTVEEETEENTFNMYLLLLIVLVFAVGVFVRKKMK